MPISEETLDEMERALARFADCVFYDNGDVTVDQSRLRTGAWLLARAALARLREERRG